jgi:hypothetical protein
MSGVSFKMWRFLPNRRRLVMVGIAIVPLVLCVSMVLRGRDTVDHFTFIRASDPQVMFQIVLSGPSALFIVALPDYDASPWRRDLPRFQHYAERTRWSTREFRPIAPVFDVLGFCEFRYGYASDNNGYAALVVPAWFAWLVCALPVAYTVRARTDGSPVRIAGRAVRTCAVVACVLPVLLAGFLWWRSYRAWDYLVYGTPYSETAVSMSGGWVALTTSPLRRDRTRVFTLHDVGRFQPQSAERQVRRRLELNAPVRTFGSVYADAQPSYSSVPIRAYAAPLWALTLLATLPSCVILAIALRRKRTALRQAAGACVKCGYDLRATPHRCPECGSVPQPPHNPPTQSPDPHV